VRKRLQVRDFLTEESAERIHGHLCSTPWGVAWNEGPRVVHLSAQQVAALTAADRQQITAEVGERARHGYQFFYSSFAVLDAYLTPGAAHSPLFDVLQFLNSDAFLSLMRRITGQEAIRWADAHATLYRAGHFLKYHTDEKPSAQRLAAYVLNLTKKWGRDWGGQLQFFDERGDVEQAWRPVFNALNVFTVPADHAVSQVADYAPGHRYSITGWLRGDAPPPFRGA
jgi:Rps23 Pro-64 3,4-dihydroxylase Tpa1-like proline 4-hydroxylase